VKKILIKNHQLLNEKPELWNNVPVCLVDTVKNMISSIVDSDESVYEYEMCTNNRIYKLQE